MKKYMLTVLCAFLSVLCMTALATGLLPELTEAFGIAMPSLGEALRRYPDTDIAEEDGSTLETYYAVSESDFDTFSVYLEKKGAVLSDYQVNGNILIATINDNNAVFHIEYDRSKSQMLISYPVGTFDEWLKNAKTHHHTASELAKAGLLDEAEAEWHMIPEYELYLSKDKIAAGVYEYACELVEQNKIISALKILRRVDENKCNELHASIEGFLCSLFIANEPHPFILKPDGTIVNNKNKVLERNVISHAVKMIKPKGEGYKDTILALKRDGTVVNSLELDYNKLAETYKVDLYPWGSISKDKWQNIIDLKSSSQVYAGLRSDGTVAAEWEFSDNIKYEQQVDQWKCIKQIAVCFKVVYGLKTDGTVVEAGERNSKTLSVSNWKNIKEIYSNSEAVFGLKSDGTIVSSLKRDDNSWQSEYKDLTWAKVLYMSGTGKYHTKQVNADGSTKYTVLSTKDQSVATVYEYLANAKECLAVSEGAYAFGIIKEDGHLVFLNTRARDDEVIQELEWKLWTDEREVGELYNQYYTQPGIQKRLNLSSPGNNRTAKSKSTKPTDAPSAKKVRINRGSNPNVRKSPSADSKRLGVAKSNQVYPLIEISNNNWYRIKLEDGTTGWIAGGFAEIVK